MVLWKGIVLGSLAFVFYLVSGVSASLYDLDRDYVFYFSFIFLCLLFISVSFDRIYIRPHILSYLYLAWTIYVYMLLDQKPRLIWTLLPLSVVWVNTHASFPLLLVVWFCIFIKNLVDKNVRYLFFIVLFGFGVCLGYLVNPYFLDPWKLIFVHKGSYFTSMFIGEWKSLPISYFLDFRGLVFQKIAFLVFTFFIIYYIVLWKRLDITMMFILFYYLAFKHHRFLPLLIIVAFPFVLVPMARIMQKNFVVFLLISLFSCLLFITTLSRMTNYNFGESFSNENFPNGVVAFIDKTGFRGRVFNPYSYGGYLIWRLWPKVEVFIDGRTPTIYSDFDFFTYLMASKDLDILNRVADKYNIDMLIFKRKSKLFPKMMNSPRWVMVAFDNVSALFVDRFKFKNRAEKFSLSGLDLGFLRVNPSLASRIYERLAYLDYIYPASADYKLYMAMCMFELGKYGEGKKILESAIILYPDVEAVYYNLGVFYYRSREYQKAVDLLKRALDINKYDKEALFYLGRSCYEIGSYQCSVEAFNKLLELAKGLTDKDVYWYLGLSLYKLGRYKDAIEEFKRFTVWVNDPSKAYYNIGNCLFALGRFHRAVDYYLKAIEVNRDYVDAVYNLWKTYQTIGDEQNALKYKVLFYKLKSARD